MSSASLLPTAKLLRTRSSGEANGFNNSFALSIRLMYPRQAIFIYFSDKTPTLPEVFEHGGGKFVISGQNSVEFRGEPYRFVRVSLSESRIQKLAKTKNRRFLRLRRAELYIVRVSEKRDVSGNRF